MRGDRFHDLYRHLLAAYGPQGWWPGDDDAVSVIVGAILTQRAPWAGVERALKALKENGLLSLQELLSAPADRLAVAIRPAIFHNAKARKLKAFARWMDEHYGGDISRLFAEPLSELRERLFSIYGIGPETADAVILYAARRPSFVVDAYTRRLLRRLGWPESDGGYEEIRSAFMTALPPDVSLFSEYHALIVRHGKEHCRAAPICEGCPVRSVCDYTST